jgi:transketolase
MAQDKKFKENLLPTSLPLAVVEAGATLGWTSIVGRNALVVGIDHYGASAPGELLCEKFGFSTSAVKAQIASIM